MMGKLLAAIERDDLSAVKSLLASGAPLEPNRWRRLWRRHEAMPLQLAVIRRRNEIAKCLLDHGADPNRGTESHLLPLAAAAYNRDLAMMELLVSHGADVNVPLNQASPLELAAMGKRMDLIDWLLERGADPSAVFAPRVAVYRIDGRFLRRLIEAGAKAPPDLEAAILKGKW
jgi:ankyrin repeat protein